MSESSTIERVQTPSTRESLAAELMSCGLSAGMTVLVHSSLSSLGWVCGASDLAARARRFWGRVDGAKPRLRPI